ncbi:3-methylornithyl-N6-L-lysine dehydrogenase PylD [Bacillota bacterium]
MTRLKENWIRDIEKDICEYDRELAGKTGMTLLELAAKANGIHPDRIKEAADTLKAAAVPVKAGEGIIGTFSQSVAAILRHMGFETMVTAASDVDGIYEACETGADLLFMADDNRFIGINRLKGRVSENNTATAGGYIAALEQAAGSLEGRRILVLGYGIVGKTALEILKAKGAVPMIYDIDSARTACMDPDMVLGDINQMRNYSLIFDASNTGGWIGEEMLHPQFLMAAPGIPLSLSFTLYNKYRHRVIHDWLQLGTAAMMGELCK